MKKVQKHSKPILASIIFAIIFLLGTITAFAYDAPTQLELTEFDTVTEYIFSTDEEVEYIEHFQYDYFFTDNDGNITNLDVNAPLLGCMHDFIKGTTTEHHTNNSGGCVIYIKNAYMCSVCGYIKPGEFINEITYAVCPH